jgi:outer membrane translocation and assembly module TamA
MARPLLRSSAVLVRECPRARGVRWLGAARLCALFTFALGVLAGCAHIPARRYGITELRVRGMKRIDEQALTRCLATHARERVTLGLGELSEQGCGEPPFDRSHFALRLFAWPWSDYPTYDAAVLKLDLKRIQRFYQARGYYGARVAEVRFDPAEAGRNDAPDCGAERGCKLTIAITVQEGPPVLLRRVAVRGSGTLTPALLKLVEKRHDLATGKPFDEAQYDAAKERMRKALQELGHARASVEGEVAVNRPLLWADVTFTVDPGPLCRIGEVRVKSSAKVPEEVILAAAMLRRGRVYKDSELDDAQRAVYAIGAFGSVSVRGDVGGEDELIDITIQVEPRRESEWLLGAGVMSGVLASGPQAAEWVSVPQWDVHLFGTYENRNFFGKLRRFRVEERPRMLFLDSFPGVPSDSPRFGNALLAELSQPGVIDPRTRIFAEARWEWGPDPFLLFFRHDVGTAVGLERGFFGQRLIGRVALHQDILEVSPRQPIVPDDQVPSSYLLPFVEQRLSLDLRDNAQNPKLGAYFASTFHEGARIEKRSWTYLRLTPEARGYVPLGLGVVLAARFAVGAIFIRSASQSFSPSEKLLGPLNYRLRGGGAQSNRGFGPGQLGDGLEGGIRRWESALELRIPLNGSLSLAGFVDMGDVHAGKGFRFDHLNTAVGGGLRYRTIIGPVRLDVGYRPSGIQRADGSPPDNNPKTNLGFAKFAGAIHLTLGENF